MRRPCAAERIFEVAVPSINRNRRNAKKATTSKPTIAAAKNTKRGAKHFTLYGDYAITFSLFV